MHRHPHEPKELKPLLLKFSRGEGVIKRGYGADTLVYTGRIDRVILPDLSQQSITIFFSMLYERSIGCNADFLETERWKPIAPPPGGMPFPYTWFCEQKRRVRLKLELTRTHDRCWLCAHTDPINLELFRTMLLKMFLEETQKRLSFWKRMRDRLVTCL